MRSLHPTASKTTKPPSSLQQQQQQHQHQQKQPVLRESDAVGDKTKKTKKPPPPPLSSAALFTRVRVAASASPTPTSRSPPASSRTPLRPRDHNVAPVTTRPVTSLQMRNLKATPSTMPFDKEPNSSASGRKPQLPTLAKSATRAPLTPKIASTKPGPQTVTVTTPLPRRAPRPGSAARSDDALSIGAGGGGGGSGGQRDDFTSPVSAFLSSNVTPRSGSRQSRVDSTNTTPTGTPNADRPDSWDGRAGLGISPSSLDERLRQTAGLSPLLSLDTGRGPQSSSSDSKFFYASDAKPSQQQAGPSRAFQQGQKTPTFFYANGDTVPDKQNAPTSTSSSTPIPSLGGPAIVSDVSSKFIYANGVPDLKPTLKSTFTTPVNGATASASRGTSRPATSYSAQRPVSPIKIPCYPPAKNGPQAVAGRGSVAAGPQLALRNPGSRRTSLEAAPTRSRGHSRAGSLTAEPPLSARLLVSPQLTPDIASPQPTQATAPTPTLASILQAAEELEELREVEETEEEKYFSELHSPTKSTHPQDQLEELVSNARRERKVQDLEITNASLEAINRSLERQVRKQKAELRQYKRLSRSGRLSLASTRIASASTVEGPLEDPDRILSDLSEEEAWHTGEDGEDGRLDESDLSESESGSPGPPSGSPPGSPSGSPKVTPNTVAQAQRDAKHRKRDERRLQLDLSKHQQLLIDSQKINQSIKRCLGWTEELIREGKKALAFQVRVSEVQLGGHVLAPPDEEDEFEKPLAVAAGFDDQEDDTIRVQIDGCDVDEESNAPLGWPKTEAQDRDSGIELPADGG